MILKLKQTIDEIYSDESKNFYYHEILIIFRNKTRKVGRVHSKTG